MRGKCLLIASPLIPALVFGTVAVSQASVVPTSVSAGDSHVTATLKAAPPTCTRNFNGELRTLCSRGFNEGYTEGQASCKGQQPRQGLAPELQDAAYDHGYNAGFKLGKASC
ncbi:hypothetical protein [Nonomuraea sp. NPDC003804]|uniref:hypothetical protein n=1 Tax=Nonomuraea sp. NPDC003804 TaxID=3154547 RepID=UPI0033A53EE0